MARRIKSLHHGDWKEGGKNIVAHREHRSKKGRRRDKWGPKIAKNNRMVKLKKFVRTEDKEMYGE